MNTNVVSVEYFILSKHFGCFIFIFSFVIHSTLFNAYQNSNIHASKTEKKTSETLWWHLKIENKKKKSQLEKMTTIHRNTTRKKMYFEYRIWNVKEIKADNTIFNLQRKQQTNEENTHLKINTNDACHRNKIQLHCQQHQLKYRLSFVEILFGDE